MIDRDHELPLTRQAELLRLCRGSLIHQPRGCVHEFWPTCADEYWPTLRGLMCYAGPDRA